MIIIYNLFSNCINAETLDYLKEYISDFNRGSIITYIKQQVNLLFESEDMEVFNRLSRDVFNICNNIRTYNISLAHEMYITLYYEVTAKDLFNEYANYEKKLKLIDKMNFTEMYYNIAKLKWDSGDYDNALNYIIHADVQNTIHTNEPRGTFVKFLLNSKGYVLWNIVPNLNYDFRNNNLEFEIAQFLGIENDNNDERFKKIEDSLRELLNDFDILLLLQFINSVNRYHNFSGERSNEYKSLREFKILGELVWLFECYLKDKFSISNKDLYNLISTQLFVESKYILKTFFNYDNLDVPSKVNKKSREYYEESLEYMLNELRTKSEQSERMAIYIRITYLLRNYTSHNVDDKFFKPNKDNHSRQFYMIIISSFLIAYKLINNTEKR